MRTEKESTPRMVKALLELGADLSLRSRAHDCNGPQKTACDFRKQNWLLRNTVALGTQARWPEITILNGITPESLRLPAE